MIQVFKPVFHVDQCLAEISAVLESGWAGLGPKTAEFELRMAEVVGAKHFVATNSCTSALQLALHALNLPAGSKVLTSPITFVSANAVIKQAGMIPVFCDVEPRTGNVDASKLEDVIMRHSPRVAIFPHIGGYPCDIDAIRTLCSEASISLIWDCAHALGARYLSRLLGDPPTWCCWSFQAVKNLPMGDGGGISCNSPANAERFRRLRWCGIDKSTSDRSQSGGYIADYDVPELGFKAHMNDITAAIGLAELPYLEQGNLRRFTIANRYLLEIKVGCGPDYQFGRASSFHFLPWFFEHRDAVAAKLRAAGIFPGMHYKRNDGYPPFEGALYGDGVSLHAAEWYEKHELTLPLHLAMSDDDVTRVIEVVNQCQA